MTTQKQSTRLVTPEPCDAGVAVEHWRIQEFVNLMGPFFVSKNWHMLKLIN